MLSSQGNGHVSRPVDGKIKQLVNQKKKVQTLLKLFRTSTPPEKNPENFPILFYLHPESTTMYYQYTAFLKSIFTMTRGNKGLPPPHHLSKTIQRDIYIEHYTVPRRHYQLCTVRHSNTQ
mmetsp:Transcript_1693/g.2747  ORF Transcript_1693/g.2747 Transcript_1693/m.2747 type:complete len:120 (+) Transcript_1693:269-628(+)